MARIPHRTRTAAPDRRAEPAFRAGTGLALLAGLVLALVASCRSSGSGDGGPSGSDAARSGARATAAVDAEHYFLDLDLDPDARSLRGLTRVQLVALEDRVDAIALDLVGLEVSAVRDGLGRELDHVQRDGRIVVELDESLARGERIELAVSYAGTPRGGLWYTAVRDGRPTQVFTQGECEDARRWFPCIDRPSDRATSELRVRMPADWVSVAAGERVESRLDDGRRVEHWRMSVPHPPYLTTLVAGELEVVEEDWNGLPLWFVAEERHLELVPHAFDETDEALAFLEEVTGRRYPYSKYAQACVEGFPFGGMENVSASTLTDATLRDERGRRDSQSVGLVVHELAHQWFGDLLTCREWSHIWLNEGFATYMTLLYYERTRGVDEFRVRLRDSQEAYLAGDSGEDRRPMLYAKYEEPMDLFFGGWAYDGGAARLHLLRHELGDEAFFEGVRRYVADHAGRGVLTDDLRVSMEAASGRDLAPFFEQWFRAAGYPELVVRWSFVPASSLVRLEVEQVQEPVRGTPGAFRFPVDVELRTAAGTTVHRVVVDRRRQRFDLPCEAEPVWVLFDEHGAIPKRVRNEKTAAEWMAIAAGDDDPNGRRDALEALGTIVEGERNDRAREELMKVLVRRLREDPLPAVRVAAVRALGRAGGSEARFHLTVAANADPAAAVRVATLEELRRYGGDPALADLATKCFDEGFSWKTMIAAAGLHASAEPGRSFDWIRARLELDSPHQTLREGLVRVLAEKPQPQAAALLRSIGLGLDEAPSVRAAAIRGWPRALPKDEELRRELGELLLSDRLPVRRAAVEAIVELGDPESIRDLELGHDAALLSFERRAIEDAIAKLAR